MSLSLLYLPPSPFRPTGFVPCLPLSPPLAALRSSLARPAIPLSEFSPCRYFPHPPSLVRSLARSLIPACIKMKMDRTARQMAKWIYAGGGRNFHFSVANCTPRLSASGAHYSHEALGRCFLVYLTVNGRVCSDECANRIYVDDYPCMQNRRTLTRLAAARQSLFHRRDRAWICTRMNF